MKLKVLGVLVAASAAIPAPQAQAYAGTACVAVPGIDCPVACVQGSNVFVTVVPLEGFVTGSVSCGGVNEVCVTYAIGLCSKNNVATYTQANGWCRVSDLGPGAGIAICNAVPIP